MQSNSTQSNQKPGFFKSLVNDFRNFFKQMGTGDFTKAMRRDFRELKESFLDDEQKKRLPTMNWFKRWFFLTVWLLGQLFIRLSLYRRVLLIIGIVLLVSARNSGEDSSNKVVFGALLLLFVLILELKDKLLAKDELKAGRAVQIALMPEQNPSVPGWSLWLFTRPANDVGGDLVDYIPLKKDKYGVVISDVAGKGLGAALFTAKLQTILRTLAPDFVSLSKLVKKINEIFFRDHIPSRFASLLYLVIQSNSGIVQFINAGHFPPIKISQDKIEVLSKGMSALGIVKNEKFFEQKLDLLKDDILLGYSDGVIEAKNEQGKFFGEERLHELIQKNNDLSATEFGSKILTEVEHFVGDESFSDDISIIVLKRNENVSGAG